MKYINKIRDLLNFFKIEIKNFEKMSAEEIFQIFNYKNFDDFNNLKNKILKEYLNFSKRKINKIENKEINENLSEEKKTDTDYEMLENKKLDENLSEEKKTDTDYEILENKEINDENQGNSELEESSEYEISENSAWDDNSDSNDSNLTKPAYKVLSVLNKKN